MKKLMSAGLVLFGILMSTSSFAVLNSAEGSTTCYVFKANKLFKKAICNYTAHEGYSGEMAISSKEFQIKNYGEINYSMSFNTYDDNAKEEYLLKGKPAISQYRSTKTLKVVKIGNEADLECYKEKKGPLEICYIPTAGEYDEFGMPH